MSNTKTVEILVGIFVSFGVVSLLVLALNVSNLGGFSSSHYYTVIAKFDNVSGLKDRSAVMIAGVTIGRVSSITVDPLTFEAIVKITIDDKFNEVPVDSDAGIYTAGLLGEKYIGITPGGAADFLEQDSEIRLTQSSIILEKLISRFLFSQAEK